MSNHGKVGKALYIKMTKEKFEDRLGRKSDLCANQLVSEEVLEGFGISSDIPFYLNENTKGEYEVICENGVEVY